MSEIITIRPPKSFRWEPAQDITAYELALALPALLSMDGYSGIDYLARQPASVRRHFVEQ